MGAVLSPPGRRFAWKKFAIGVMVLIGLVYFWGPSREDLDGYVPSIMRPDVPSQHYEHAQYPVASPPHNDDTAPSARPTDPASDGDLTKTHYCTKSYKAGVPLVQFALMIDMGAVGSRIHIYKFNNCGPSPEYEYEVFKQRPGELSLYHNSPRAAAESLDVLLDEAVRVVPESLRRCTPLQVKVTAALRVLGMKEASDILVAIRHRMEERYPFSLQGENAVEIMEGRDKGVYAWLTANYLLKTLSNHASAKTTPPYAVIDLGVGLTQIVFEPTFDAAKPNPTLAEGEHKYDLKYDGQTRVLYEHGHRGYGLMSARQSTHQVVEFMDSLRGSDHGKDAVVPNPCLAQGTEKTVEIEDKQGPGKRWRSVTMVGEDVGRWEACNRVVELVMAKDAICKVKPCSFNGTYQPPLSETFPHGKIMLLHKFYDALNPFVATTVNPLKAPFHVSAFADLAKIVCQGRAAWKEHWGPDRVLMEELERCPEWCLDLTFMHALLHFGYGLDGDREIQLGTHVDGTELGWYLGASVAAIAGMELKCRV
ncbi:nucleoside phosphatase family-domain-containing protein [Cerioporus squamosus]|nr:nucleoside phosphatase family-domain-containing protein [Cerioporus squamosus]